MRLQQQHAICAWVVVLEQIEKVRDVAETLRHLLALGIDHETVVHPMSRKVPTKCHRLRPLILMMRKAQIGAPTVQVEPVAKQLQTHDHTFAVPARPPITPRRRPTWLTRLRELPQREVGWMPFLTRPQHFAFTTTGEHVVEALVREQPVVRNCFDRQVHTVVGVVRSTACDQSSDHVDHLVHIFRRMRNVGRPQNS